MNKEIKEALLKREDCTIHLDAGEYDVKTDRYTKGYFSQQFDLMPNNWLINKQVTGCGATHAEIISTRHSIIAVPYTSLITNKQEDPNISNLEGVYAGATIGDIKDYAINQLNNNEHIKIMTTYDSIDKVIEGLEEAGINPYKEVFLMIDEFHCLRTQYSFRSKAVRNLLAVAKDFINVSYVTATPINRKYALKALEAMPILSMNWSNAEPLSVKSVPVQHPAQAVVKLIKEHLDNPNLGNLYFFVNSILFMQKVMKGCKDKGFPLTSEEVKIFCADNPSNQLNLLGSNIPISTDFRKTGRINFLTSKCFEGVDIFDAEGRSIVVSDGDHTHSLIDIETAVKQIAGRIRDAKNKTITHITNVKLKSKYNISQEEFDAAVEDERVKCAELLEMINENTKRSEKLQEEFNEWVNDKAGTYIQELENGEFEFDEELVVQDKYNFDIMNSYKTYVRLTNRYTQSGGIVTLDAELNIKLQEEVDKAKLGKKLSKFRVLIELIGGMKIIETIVFFNRNKGLKGEIIKQYPSVFPALKYIGLKEIKAMGFSKKKVEEKLDSLGIIWKADESILRKTLTAHFTSEYNKPITATEAKTKLKGILKALGIKGHPATMKYLLFYFEVSEKKVRIDGVQKKLKSFVPRTL